MQTVAERRMVRHPRALLAAAALTFSLWLGAGATPAQANRFGPPWEATVTADQAIVYAQPDKSAPIVGPVPRDAMLIVIGETKSADGTYWVAMEHGWIPGDQVAEMDEPWIAEVSAASASVYAKPNATLGIRKTARQGQLLRVTGVSPGVDGDTGTWWATTEGYARLDTLKPATSDWARGWQVPDGQEAVGGWWGTVRSSANLRAGASTKAPVVGEFAAGTRLKVLAEETGEPVQGNDRWYRIDGGRYAGARIHSSLVQRSPDLQPVASPAPEARNNGTWIAVDRVNYSLTLYQNGQPQFTTLVTIGKAGRETPIGEHSTFGKFRVDDMTSTSVPDAESPYDLPNVPYVQYYKDGGYAIHGTYWHDAWASQESQGCINLLWGDAAYLFSQTQPTVGQDELAKWSQGAAATPVMIVN